MSVTRSQYMFECVSKVNHFWCVLLMIMIMLLNPLAPDRVVCVCGCTHEYHWTQDMMECIRTLHVVYQCINYHNAIHDTGSKPNPGDIITSLTCVSVSVSLINQRTYFLVTMCLSLCTYIQVNGLSEGTHILWISN